MKENKPTVIRPDCRQKMSAAAKMVYKGVLFEVWQWEQELFNGKKAIFEKLRRPDTVLIIPITDAEQVIFAEESQPGMPTVLHAIGGRVEVGESPEAAARRELMEESGYIANELRLWDAWQPVDKIDWAVYLFVAHGLSAGSNKALDSGEKIKLKMFPFATLLNHDDALKIDDYELLHKLYLARSNSEERARVLKLLELPL